MKSYFTAAFLLFVAPFSNYGQAELSPEVQRLESRISAIESRTVGLDSRVVGIQSGVSTLEQKIAKLSDTAPTLFLFGVFCALWAQNTGRNAWLWFFLGLLLSYIAGVVLLWKNAGDKQNNAEAFLRAGE
jgi:hypothetical protein